jgi:hypothetical protein
VHPTCRLIGSLKRWRRLNGHSTFPRPSLSA